MTKRNKKINIKPFVDLAKSLRLYLLAIVVLMLVWRYKFDIQVLVLSQTKRDVFLNIFGAKVQDFMTLAIGVIVEALPFVVLGVAISSLVRTYVNTEKIYNFLPKSRVGRKVCLSFLGMAMPVCECGNVPVARTLLLKKFTVDEALVFLLAAPSVNLVTLIVTMEAFKVDQWIAWARLGFTILIANVTALLVIKLVPKNRLLNEQFNNYCAHYHSASSRFQDLVAIFRKELWIILKMLVVGALIAAAFQILVPREIISAIGTDPLMGVLAMLILAFVISICSSVDAFFALAYTPPFSLGAALSFMLAGPMVDIKMLSLLKTTFSSRVIVLISASVFVLAFIIGVFFAYVI